MQRQGEQALADDKPEAAMGYYEKALLLAPRNVQEELGEEAAAATKAIEEKDRRLGLIVKQGQAQYAAMEFGKALASFTSALKMAPKKRGTASAIALR